MLFKHGPYQESLPTGSDSGCFRFRVYGGLDTMILHKEFNVAESGHEFLDPPKK